VTGSQRVKLNDDHLLDLDGGVIPLVADLLTFCSEAFAADRLSSRGKSPDDSRWHRDLQIDVPVEQSGLWSRKSVRDKATELLSWLTDDEWTVQFVKAPRETSQRQTQLDVDPIHRMPMLFSGGLDAAAGAALKLASTPLLAVGVVTNPAMSGYQRRTFVALARSGLGSIRYCPVPFSLIATGAKDDEPTRRTRGLVFLGAGVSAALQRGGNRLLVAENGIGALNLPFTEAQSGAMTSRSVHPRTLRLVAELVGELTDQNFTIENPFLSWTKGQMVRALPTAAKEACAASESCDSAAVGRGKLQRRCGHCTSCLLRRVSFQAAGRTDWDPRPYLADTAINENRWRLPEVLWQAARFDEALQSEDASALETRFPDLAYVREAELSRKELAVLLRTYVEEWRQFPDANVSRFLPNPVAEAARA
jgi:hypothetical protein